MTCSPDWNGPLERLERQTFPQTFQRIPCKHWPERLERLERLERQKKAKAGAIPAKRCRATPRRQSGQRAGCCTTPTASRLKCGSRPLPTMRLNPAVQDIFAFRFEDFTLEGYDPHPHIKAEVAV